MENATQATEEELKKQRYKCWRTDCKSRAWLIDWTGYHLCLRHWYRSWRWGGGEVSIRSFIFALKNTEMYF